MSSIFMIYTFRRSIIKDNIAITDMICFKLFFFEGLFQPVQNYQVVLIISIRYLISCLLFLLLIIYYFIVN